MAQHPISDEIYARIAAHFSEQDMALLTVAISQINAWNRIAAPFRFAPPIPASV
jgi:alkylhydroperoxidase family enzyme